jgi:hypothetical protein
MEKQLKETGEFENLYYYFEKRLEEIQEDYNEKIAHLQRKFFANSNYDIEIFEKKEFKDGCNYIDTINAIISVEEVKWKNKNCTRMEVNLVNSNQVFSIFLIDGKVIPSVGNKITFKYDYEYNKLSNVKIIA